MSHVKQFTPTEYAKSVAIEALRQESLDTALPRKYRKQIAKLHNRLLKTSGMDGVELDEDPQ